MRVVRCWSQLTVSADFVNQNSTTSDIQFLIDRDVGLAFASIRASALLGRFSTRFRSVNGNYLPFMEKPIVEVRH